MFMISFFSSKKLPFLLPVFFFWAFALAAQQPQKQNPAQSNNGRLYGKVVDETTGKGLGYASVQLVAMRMDSASGSKKEKVIAGQLTEENGEFSLENLPVMGKFRLKIIFMGYASAEQEVSFGPFSGRPNNGEGSMNMAAFDKDLGNIVLAATAQLLKEVTITGEGSAVSLSLDKKVYKVDKDGVAAGGTAEDVLKNVPSLSVDIDGNVSLRNAAPQIFVDGRPTTLTLDQIPADVMDNIEVISNPSAKYDASGGNAGIVNIVLKKERRVGYNGNVRAGVDMRGRANLNADLNARQGKINAFIGGGYNGRKSVGTGETDRYNRFGDPLTNVFQSTMSEHNRFFASVRGGLDWFVNNRNTVTFSGNYHGGRMRGFDEIGIDTDTLLASGIRSSSAVRNTDNTRRWGNFGGQMLYKHLFPKDGKEWTADINLNQSHFDNQGNFITGYLQPVYQSMQQQNGEGNNRFITAQTDFVNPINSSMKVEAGARVAIRTYRSENASYNFDYTSNQYVRAPTYADQYEFNDQIYAAYATFSHSFKNWGYQAGLRAERSTYTGTLTDVDTSFTNAYPLSLFPSLGITYKLNDEDNVQLTYSRRINRPNFFQMTPFPDFSDSLSLSRGNPDLVPEFTNSLELSYQNIFSAAHNLLTTLYYKRAVDLITSYQFTEFDPALQRDIIVSSYANSNSSMAYGLELTLKNKFWEKLELTTNLNFYNSAVDAKNVENDLSNEQFTWLIKESLTLKLPAKITFQASGEYQSRTAFALNSGSRYMGWGGGPSSSAQGYTVPSWFVDLSLRKDIWNRAASVTLSVQDIFRSRRGGSHSESPFFVQDSWRRRDPQFVRLNFSWRFGKFDVALFKRKNTRVNTEGMDSGF